MNDGYYPNPPKALVDRLYERVSRVPRGGLVAVTMAEVEQIRLRVRCETPWPPPSLTPTALLGVPAIVIDRPPLPVPPNVTV